MLQAIRVRMFAPSEVKGCNHNTAFTGICRYKISNIDCIGKALCRYSGAFAIHERQLRYHQVY